MSSVQPPTTAGRQGDEAVLAELFAAGEALAAGGDRPFLLRGDDVWLVAAGQVNVFAVRLEQGQPAGPRTHLVQVSSGQALFGLGQPPLGERWGLLAVGASGTRLLRLARAALGGGAGRARSARWRWSRAGSSRSTRP